MRGVKFQIFEKTLHIKFTLFYMYIVDKLE